MAKKQKNLPGIKDDNIIQELEDAAEAVSDADEARTKAQAHRDEVQEAAMALMKDKKIKTYRTRTLVPNFDLVASAGKAKLSVRKVKEEPQIEED